ncbi:hypothetical protein D6777_03460 [Candidatus Woesearchaeota archaeon]|nr:MAG: hypothetical protein D6777_03460 [Candidatus Woesearchaeota archaeon]
MGLLYQKYRDGIIALGLALGIGMGGYITLDNYPTRRDRRNEVVRKSLDIIIDSSLSKKDIERVKSVVHDVVDKYNETFKIKYDVRFRFRQFRSNLNKNNIVSGDNQVHESVYFVSGDVPDQDNWLGFTDYRHNSIIIDTVHHQCTDQLYTVLAHELGHINGYFGHQNDAGCIMGSRTGCERKRFCPTTIETILTKK